MALKHLKKWIGIPALIGICGSATLLAAKKAAPMPAAAPEDHSHLAFPGAFGFGRFATGGRGGELYHVSTLEDSGPGSFRDAVSKPNRTVVFDVGGYVDLKSTITGKSNLTIAGQTAPGEGIALKNYEVSFSGEQNIIVRYVRFRQGLTPGQDKKYVLGLGRARNVVFDHCSIEWGRWDCIGLSDSQDVTLQYCLIGEGVDPQRFGCLCESDNVTFSHNLWINNQSRNPKAKGKIQYINNVVYNWGVCGLVGGHSGADHYLAAVNNYFIKGPSSNDHFAGEFANTDKVFQSGNVVDLDRDGQLNGKPADEKAFGSKADAPTFVTTPFAPLGEDGIDSADVAVKKVIATAGDSIHRDSVDTRLIREVFSFGKEGKISKDPADVGGPGEIKGGPTPKDSDKDGIPDDWETAHGLNPNDPSDAAKVGADGYTMLETYLESLVPSGD